MKKYIYKNLRPDEIKRLIERPKIDFKSIFSIVQPIIDRIETDGDSALKTYTKEFDGVDIDNPIFDPNKIEVELDEEVKKAERILSIFEDANTGLVMVDGKLIEKPVLRQMQRTVDISNKLKSS